MTATVGAATKPAAPSAVGANPPAGSPFSWRLAGWTCKLLAVPLHRAVLRPLRHLRRLSRWCTPPTSRLHDWTLTGGDKGFIGLDNYQDVLADDQFWNAIVNTFGIFLLSTVPQLLLALLLANLLNQRLRARTFFRMGIFFPTSPRSPPSAIVFGLLFAERFGMVNWLLRLHRRRPDRLASSTAGPPGSPSRPWSTGGGPATTR